MVHYVEIKTTDIEKGLVTIKEPAKFQLPVSSKITRLSKNSKSQLTRRAERLNNKVLSIIENN